MLALDMKAGGRIIMGDNLITIEIISTDRGRVRVGIDAPKEMSVHREEIFNKIKRGEKDAI